MVRFGRLTRSVRYNDNDNNLEKDFDLESNPSLSKDLESVFDSERSKDFDVESNTSLSRSMPDRKIPIQISRGSSLRDDRRSSTSDQRYYPNSFNQRQKRLLPPLSQSKDNDERYYPNSCFFGPERNTKSKDQPPPSNKVSPTSPESNIESNEQPQPSQQVSPTSSDCTPKSNEQPLPSQNVSPTSPERNTKSKEQPPPSQQVSPMSNNQCDTSDEVSPCTYEDESSIEDSTKSEDSDDHSSLSMSNYDQLTIAYAKHQMMVALMEEFYTNFDPQWQNNVRSHVAPSSRSSRSYADSSKSQNSSRQDSNGKRAMRDREPSPDDNANNGKKRRGNPTDARGDEPDPQFACPFRKYDPRKYCSNLDTGTKYRSCIGPGFSTISKLK